MAKTYVPSAVDDIHALAVYLARYNSVIRAYLTLTFPEYLATYETLYAAVSAMDAIRLVLRPVVS